MNPSLFGHFALQGHTNYFKVPWGDFVKVATGYDLFARGILSLFRECWCWTWEFHEDILSSVEMVGGFRPFRLLTYILFSVKLEAILSSET